MAAIFAVLGSIESSAFSTWLRESPSLLAFPLMLSLHAIGMGLAAGINGAIALRILGVAPGVPLGGMRPFLRVMWAGFWMNAASGVALLIAYPTKALTNPDFYLKLTFIALALVTVRALDRRVFRAPQALDAVPTPPGARVRRLAVASLTCWAGAIIAGRLLAYTYTQLLASWR
ncbi:MAG: hypothetical protein LAO77_06295 [Acidobacteriia bacterium]|nr:hypothetical protein [Terriglobia bacterium]